MKSKISSAVSAAGFALLAPIVTVFAQTPSTLNGGFTTGGFFDNALAFVQRIMKGLFPTISALLILLFGYQVVKYLTDKSETEKAIHKSNLLKAIIAIALWFTLFGIIGLLANAVGVEVGKDVEDGSTTKVTF